MSSDLYKKDTIEYKYFCSDINSKERLLGDFLAAYFHQDADEKDESIVVEYINDCDDKTIKLTLDAIDELISTKKFTTKEISNFICYCNSCRCSNDAAINWLLDIKKLLIKHSVNNRNYNVILFTNIDNSKDK